MPTTLPETILQFGTGKFMRAFADLFIHQANELGQAVGRVVVLQSTGGERAQLLQAGGGKYHVWVRGLEHGRPVERVEESRSISRALSAAANWDQALELARSPDLRTVLSNTAEEGYQLDPNDGPDSRPPRSFPAKLLVLLAQRYQAGLPGLTIYPCELFEQNAQKLRMLVMKLAGEWQFPEAVRDWISQSCSWRSTLVDRIVAGKPAPPSPCAEDPLLTVAEPYALWAMETHPGQTPLLQHPAVVPTPDVRPYFLRKVRILNGAHTALLSQALPRGMRTVREAVSDPAIRAWLEELLFEEIVPVLVGRVEGPEAFARQTLERFANPFLEHKLSDIASYHAAKVDIRLRPTRDEYLAQFGRPPALLEAALATPIAGVATH